MIFILILHILLFFLFSIKVWSLLIKTGWTAFIYSSLYIILFYLIAPIISIVYFHFFGSENSFAYNIPSFSDFTVIFFSFITISIGLLAFYIGYSRTRGWPVVVVKDKYISGVRVSSILALSFLFISLMGVLLYVNGVGSLSRAIEIANLIRTGIYAEEAPGDTSYTFFYRFMFLAIIPFWYCFYDNLQDRSSIRLVMFPVSLLILILVYVFLSSGRQSIIDVFLLLLLSSLIRKNKIIDTKLVVFVVTAFLALPILTTFFLSKNVEVAASGSATFIDVFIKEFSFPYYSLVYSIQETYDFYYFSDFIEGLYGTFLPSSYNPGLEGVNYLNTFYLMGVWTKWVPPGFLATGYYSWGILGVIFISFFTGKIFKIIDVFFRSAIQVKPGFIFFYVFFILSTLSWIRTGLPHNYFYHTVKVCFLLFIYLSFRFTKNRTLPKL